MADRSAIEWTEASLQLTAGCSRVSTGCLNCYAERQAIRFEGTLPEYKGVVESTPRGPEWTGLVRTLPQHVIVPLRWRKPRRIFLCSMSDLFHKDVPEGFLRVAFGLILATPRHTYQVLTKRPERMEQFMRNTTPEQAGQALYAHLRRNFPYAWEAYVKLLDAKAMQGQGPWPPRNAWLGTSVENQEAADERIPHLVNTPAAVRFLSCEPLLGPLDLRKWLVQTDCPRCGNDPEVMACAACRGTGPLRWLIVGGESGPGARPCGVEWLRGVVQQGQATGTATFMKQLGADPRNDGHAWPKDAKGGNMEEWPGDLRVRQYPEEGRVVEVVA